MATASPRAVAAELAARARAFGQQVRTQTPAGPKPLSAAEQAIESANGRFPGVSYGAHPGNPYKPNVVPGAFPSVLVGLGHNVPPSLNPAAGQPRQGPTPGMGLKRVAPHGGVNTPGLSATLKRK
jgi:hypothetical protein